MCKTLIPLNTFWLMQMLSNLKAKRNFIFSVSTTCLKHFPVPLMVPIDSRYSALLCNAFASVFHFFVSERRVTSLHNCCMVVNGKIKNHVFKFCPPPNFFDSFAPLLTILTRPMFLKFALSILDPKMCRFW